MRGKKRLRVHPGLSLCTCNRYNILSLAHVRANEVGISNKRGVLTLILAAASAIVKGTYPKYYLGNPRCSVPSKSQPDSKHQSAHRMKACSLPSRRGIPRKLKCQKKPDAGQSPSHNYHRSQMIKRWASGSMTMSGLVPIGIKSGFRGERVRA